MQHILIILFLGLSFLVTAQNQPQNIFIESIEIVGNKKTKDAIILREIDFSVGDSVSSVMLDDFILGNEQGIFNTGLFNKVKIKGFENETDNVSVVIEVEERWYIWPAVTFELIDRNFNIWWNEFNRDFTRTIYGARLNYENISGNNDVLVAVFKNGFLREYRLEYDLPYIDKRKIYGIKPKIKYKEQKELAINTIGNQQQFIPYEQISLREFEVAFGITQRRKFDVVQGFEISYHNDKIIDSVLIANPNYFLNQQPEMQYFALYWFLEYDVTDIAFYPLNGFYHRTEIQKNGLGIFKDANYFRLRNNNVFYKSFNDNWSGLINSKWQVSFPQKQPYLFKEALGYDDTNVRGHELYLVDGQHYFLLRSALRYKLAAFEIDNPIQNIRQFKSVPFTVYLKYYNELGKVWSPDNNELNPLNNRWLPGTGVGIDISSFYDLVFSAEYSYNAIGEQGVFLQFNFKY